LSGACKDCKRLLIYPRSAFEKKFMGFAFAPARFLRSAFLVVLTGCASHSAAPLLPQTAAPQPLMQAQSVALTSPTGGTIGLFQVFDAFGGHEISSSAAITDGPRYGAVWGSRAGMPSAWRANNSGLAATYYMPQETDANSVLWGAIGHPLSWWQTYHPSWVLYACTSAGTPTKTPAYIPQLPDNVPLDIHNPAVVSYQVKLAANYAIAHGYTGLAFDEVLFSNITGEAVATTDYGCGIYQNGTFVRRYSGRNDPAWTTDTVAWVKAARSILKTDPVIGPKNLKMLINHPAYSIANVNEQTILQNVDAVVDEGGFSDYGTYRQGRDGYLVPRTVAWMAYAQSHGAVPLIIDKFYQSTAVTSVQLEYAIATYLLGNQGMARLFVGNANGYGAEQYHSEYATNFGTPCGAYYGGASYDSANPDIYYRRFSNAIAVVNAGSTTRTSELAHLPAGHTYRDLEGRAIGNPLTVASADAYVLMTTNGCQ
jgi:hypothetical protein